VEDAMIMLNEHARGPVLLVASSLGCWISTIIALRHPDRIKGKNQKYKKKEFILKTSFVEYR